jgi:class 3 adenylate cyclase/tetratricopeptide (TPR) repeat protein
LELACPECGKVNPPGSKFCNECGHQLTQSLEPTPKGLSFDEKLDKIQRYLPKGLTEKILSQRDRIEGERKQVTVMFCDLEGFTPLVEKLGPEEAYTVMDQVYEILIHKVHDYEGTVNEMTGDGILALFGAPIALEDAPQRAIRSAYAIHKEISKFSDEARQEIKGLPRLKMRIGVHTGPVVVGTLGNDLRVDFKAVGDTVNLASRMEGLAEPGATYVSEQTFKLTEGLFTFEALGKREVKGREEPVNVYRVIAPSTRRTRFDVSAERGLTPFVGREREIELLMDGFERVKAGRGQAFSIMAEAGVGKSRVLYEFRKAVANENVTFLEGKCLSYSRSVAYHPLIDILRSNFDIREGDGDFEIRQKVKKGLDILKVDEASTLPYLLELLPVKQSGIDEISMSPEMRKNRIIEAFKRITLLGSEIRPLIMAIEDLHWIDTNSEESLKNLMESISGASVFLIFTYRPEFVHTWGARSYHGQGNLNRLSNRETLTMAAHLLGTTNIHADLEALLLEKTEGVPFFVEEFINSLKNLKIIVKTEQAYRLVKDIQKLTIPTTIQDVIMARVDALPEEAKGLLQQGSVIEREFTYTLIQRVADMPEQELLSCLSVLKDSELLYERGIYPESSYIFKHALTREVIYDSVLTQRRKGIHEEIGQAIEEIYEERLEEFHEMLAYHYSKSENFERAYKYLKLSGNKATKNYSNREAFRFYRESISMLSNMSETDTNKREQIEIRLLMTVPIFLLGFPEDSLEILQKGERLSKEVGDERGLAHFLSQIGQYYSFKGEGLDIGVEYCEAAFKEAERIDDFDLMVPIGSDLCLLYWRACELSKLVEVASKLIALLDKSQKQSESFGKPFNPYAVLLAFHASGLGMFGRFEEGNPLFEKGINFALQIKDLTALAWVESRYGTMLNFKGDGKSALERYQNAIRYTKEAQMVVISGVDWMLSGWSYCLLGEFESARDCIEKGLKIHSEAGAQFHLDFFYGLSSMIYYESGDLKKAQHRAEEALKLSQKSHHNWIEGFIWIELGRIFGKARHSQDGKAEKCILRGIEILDELKLKPLYARGYHHLGELYAETGQKEKALENLGRASELFREMGMDYWLVKTQEVLKKINL